MCSVKKGFLKKFLKILRKTPVPESLIKKETLVLGFSCEFCEISENELMFFSESEKTPPVAASVY